jgi:hypothetical protein
MPAIYLDTKKRGDKIIIESEAVLIFHIPSFRVLDPYIIPHKTIRQTVQHYNQ